MSYKSRTVSYLALRRIWHDTGTQAERPINNREMRIQRTGLANYCAQMRHIQSSQLTVRLHAGCTRCTTDPWARTAEVRRRPLTSENMLQIHHLHVMHYQNETVLPSGERAKNAHSISLPSFWQNYFVTMSTSLDKLQKSYRSIRPIRLRALH